MSRMKQAMIEVGEYDEPEDDGFVTVNMNASMNAAQTALADFGLYLGRSDTEMSKTEARKLLTAAIDFMDAQPHGIDCPKCYTDHECTCVIGKIGDALLEAADDLVCPECHGEGAVESDEYPGWSQPCPCQGDEPDGPQQYP